MAFAIAPDRSGVAYAPSTDELGPVLATVAGHGVDRFVHRVKAHHERLDRRVLDLWRLQALLAAAALAVAAGEAAAAFVVAGHHVPFSLWATAMAAVVVVLAGGLVWAAIDYRHWTFEVTDEALELRHGVLTRAHSTIPFRRVQQIDINAGPLDRLLGLRRLMIRTAASTSDATIPGIGVGRAEELRRRILRASGVGDAV
ncbi:MAG: PH domain-containing protein [Acidimicrobiales bacterium]